MRARHEAAVRNATEQRQLLAMSDSTGLSERAAWALRARFVAAAKQQQQQQQQRQQQQQGGGSAADSAGSHSGDTDEDDDDEHGGKLVNVHEFARIIGDIAPHLKGTWQLALCGSHTAHLGPNLCSEQRLLARFWPCFGPLMPTMMVQLIFTYDCALPLGPRLRVPCLCSLLYCLCCVQEFTAGLAAMGTGHVEERLRIIFDVFDVDSRCVCVCVWRERRQCARD